MKFRLASRRLPVQIHEVGYRTAFLACVALSMVSCSRDFLSSKLGAEERVLSHSLVSVPAEPKWKLLEIVQGGDSLVDFNMTLFL